MGVMIFSVISSANAQTAAPAPVEVRNVKFNRVDGWYVTEVEIQGRPGSATDNRNFINRVKVTLNLGVFSAKAEQGARIPDTYYRASAEAVAIETTGRSVFRFYLPPEIVKRDQIAGDAKFYLVELSVGGQQLPLTERHYPTSTLKGEIVESFRSKVASEAGKNEGILLPQYLTPFAYANSAPAPTFVRIENSR